MSFLIGLPNASATRLLAFGFSVMINSYMTTGLSERVKKASFKRLSEQIIKQIACSDMIVVLFFCKEFRKHLPSRRMAQSSNCSLLNLAYALLGKVRNDS